MNDADRFKLLFGPYQVPRFWVGQIVRCEVRGEVRIVGLSDAPIPWPVCKAGKWRVPVVYQGLAKAVRRESAQAVGHWWGASKWAVWTWKKALGVPVTTEGTSRLRSDYTHEPWAVEARQKAHAKAQDPQRREKIAAARRGKLRPARVVEAVVRAHKGKPLSEEARRKLSAAHKVRGTLVPGTRLWTPEEDELVRTLPRSEAAERTGRTLTAVTARRRRLGLPDGRRVVRLRQRVPEDSA
jgi:hypothetical protein